MEEIQLEGKIIIKGNILVKTGLAIGGSTTSLDIGGMDNPVIKDANGVPYIPGSSIKGKIRSLLEQAYYPLRNVDEKDNKGYFHENHVIHLFKDNRADDIIKIFGAPDVDQPVRGIFRDAYLDLRHFEENEEIMFKDLELTYTEDKIENSIDRISSKATPRHLERVPIGAQFNFELILDLYSEKDKDLLKVLFQGLKLLEDDYLGGSGTRGSGKIIFNDLDLFYRSVKFYKTEEKQIDLNTQKINLKDIDSEKWFSDVIGKIDL